MVRGATKGKKTLVFQLPRDWRNLLNVARLSYMYEIFLTHMEQEGKFTRLTVLIAKTSSLQANLTQFGCEIGIQLEGANA